ncbi:MAG: FIST C-terminal domain-containing protein [Myxococcota bacterium]|nr:FIST C-terminal domain-containing protein [Myxococcota bacterium]
MQSAHLCLSSLHSWEKAVEAITLELDGLGFQPELAFLYITDHFVDYGESIRHSLQSRLQCPLSGTVGIGICGKGKLLFDQPGIGLLVLTCPKELYREVDSTLSVSDFINSVKETENPILHCSPQSSQELFDTNHLPGFMLGGLSSSRRSFLQFHSYGSSYHGLTGFVFSEKARLGAGLSQGCRILDSNHTVTKLDASTLAELDNLPALDVLMDAMKLNTFDELVPYANQLFAAIPLPNRDIEDYVVRQFLTIDPASKMIEVAHPMHIGDTLRFALRSEETAIESMESMLRKLKNQFDTKPYAGLYFSCVGRGPFLFDGEAKEVELIDKFFPDLPWLGFFSNGELYNDQLYTYTGVLCLLHE